MPALFRLGFFRVLSCDEFLGASKLFTYEPLTERREAPTSLEPVFPAAAECFTYQSHRKPAESPILVGARGTFYRSEKCLPDGGGVLFATDPRIEITLRGISTRFMLTPSWKCPGAYRPRRNRHAQAKRRRVWASIFLWSICTPHRNAPEKASRRMIMVTFRCGETVEGASKLHCKTKHLHATSAR